MKTIKRILTIALLPIFMLGMASSLQADDVGELVRLINEFEKQDVDKFLNERNVIDWTKWSPGVDSSQELLDHAKASIALIYDYRGNLTSVAYYTIKDSAIKRVLEDRLYRLEGILSRVNESIDEYEYSPIVQLGEQRLLGYSLQDTDIQLRMFRKNTLRILKFLSKDVK